MPKTHSQFVCQQCGYKSPSFLGKCPNCDAWNSLVETIEAEKSSPWAKVNKRERKVKVVPVKLNTVRTADFKRISSGIMEVDQVLGGVGFVPGSVVLLSGDPGIGKSTLALQILANIGGLYVAGEESQEQVSLRAARLKIPTNKILILNETNVESVIENVKSKINDIKLLVVDSVQTAWSEELTGAPGSVGQVRECTLKLLDLAKSNNLPMILIGHVTKEGTIAGPMVLEHIVDTVLYLEGERFQSLRILRSTKNRYGAVDEVGVFSMEEKGLQEVANPSEIFLGEQPSYASDSAKASSDKQASAGKAGSVIVATMEGSRPLLVEVQALTVSTNMPIARRVGTGINANRLQMLVAILQKHLRLPLGNFDIYVNAASGIKVFEPAADLGICLAIVSSFKNKPLPPKTVALGEVGLLGEIRNVIGLDRRIKEARKLGFTHILSSKNYNHISRIASELF